MRRLAFLAAPIFLACAPLRQTRDARYLPHWFAGFSAGVVENSVLVTDGVDLFWGTKRGFVHAASGRSGRGRWRARVDGTVDGSPLVADGAVYVGTVKGKFYALDKSNGKKRWEYAIDREVTGKPVRCGPALLIGTQGGQFYALEAATGKYLWKFKREVAERIAVSAFSAACAGDNLAIVGFSDGGLAGFTPATGDKQWSVDGTTAGAKFPDVAWIAPLGEKSFLAGTFSGSLGAFNASDGSQLWQLDEAASTAEPLRDAATGNWWIAGEKDVRRIDVSTGTEAWRHSPKKAPRWAGLAVLGDFLLASSFDGGVAAFGAADGKPRWTWVFDGPLQGAPVVIGSRAWVLTKKGHLISLQK